MENTFFFFPLTIKAVNQKSLQANLGLLKPEQRGGFTENKAYWPQDRIQQILKSNQQMKKMQNSAFQL